MENNCLNCETPLTDRFCARCGQKADTHRITAKHFMLHDLMHGVWHIDKGILFTLKEVFTRPGYAALDYIKGKRVKYYNIFYLMLIVVGLILIADHYQGEKMWETGRVGKSKAANLMAQYAKLFFMVIIPIFCINAQLLFRKLKINFFEHHIIAGFCLLGMYICLLIGFLLGGNEDAASGFTIKVAITWLIGIIFIAFPIVTYYQATKRKYSFMGFTWRIILFYFLVIFEIRGLIKSLNYLLNHI